jgi:Holliday junction resolvase RusA-like endonuclease
LDSWKSGPQSTSQSDQQWREMAQAEILCQMSENASGTLRERSAFPISSKVSVAIALVGSHRGDLDNLAGAVLDALVGAGILEDDRLSCVSRLVVEHQPSSKEVGCSVEISYQSPSPR